VKAVEAAVTRGEYASPDLRVLGSMTVFGVLVGVATVLVVLLA
jgi:hypothetical protein